MHRTRAVNNVMVERQSREPSTDCVMQASNDVPASASPSYSFASSFHEDDEDAFSLVSYHEDGSDDGMNDGSDNEDGQVGSLYFSPNSPPFVAVTPLVSFVLEPIPGGQIADFEAQDAANANADVEFFVDMPALPAAIIDALMTIHNPVLDGIHVPRNAQEYHELVQLFREEIY
jgi:hypothetical protein